MIKDVRDMAEGSVIESSVCIIGGGVAGVSIASELMDADIDVALIESGGLKAEKATQALCEGDSVGHPYFPLETARSRQFGGSSNRWLLEVGENRVGARLRPLDPIDFERRDWVPHSGWPFGYEELEPYYRQAQSICRSGPFRYRPRGWEGAAAEQLPFARGRVDTAIYQFVGRDVFGSHYQKRIAASQRVHAYIHANVLEVLTDSDGTRATGARLATLEGKRLEVRARLVILAAGGIETPRLMLLSRSVHKNGLGNGSDLVGRFFMEHPHLWSGHYVPANPGVFARSGLYNIHMREGVPVLGQLCLGEHVMREHRLLNYSAHLVPALRPGPGVRHTLARGKGSFGMLAQAVRQRDLNDFNRHLSTIFPVANDFSVAAYRRAVRLFNRLFRKNARFEVFRLNHMAEQAPNPASRVFLGEELDRFGQPKVVLDWRLTPEDVGSIRRIQHILDQEVRREGMGHIAIELGEDMPPPEIHGGWHHMGTTRMHASPRQGVVDPDGRVHGMANLYIAGPSVFPTSGYANPVLTIVALASRLAEKVKRELRPHTGTASAQERRAATHGC